MSNKSFVHNIALYSVKVISESVAKYAQISFGVLVKYCLSISHIMK